MQALRKLTTERKPLLIVDDVQSGTGRCGMLGTDATAKKELPRQCVAAL